MISRASSYKALNRLLAAVLICFAVVFSQMAHADVAPLHDAAPPHEVTSSHAHAVVEGDGHPRAYAEEASADHEHDGKGEAGKCASHCPASFVPTDGDAPVDAWGLPTKRVSFDTALNGILVALSERPPRA